MMLLNEVDGSNQLIEACRLYMASDLFLAELESLAYFNHHVTFPFLNCIECSSQSDLLKILPKLYRSLLDKKMDVLSDFVVRIHGMPLPALTTDLSRDLPTYVCVCS